MTVFSGAAAARGKLGRKPGRSLQNRCLGGLLALILSGAAGQTGAETLVAITSPDALTQALAAAKPGTVITLAAGDYGALTLDNMGGDAGNPVTLRSADPKAPAQFSSMSLTGTRHLVLEGLRFTYSFTEGAHLVTRDFQVSGGQDITFRQNLFQGDMASGMSEPGNGFPTGVGLWLSGVAGVTFEHNELRGFYKALAVRESTDVVVQNNDLHDIRMDGMTFAQVQRLRIEGNHIHDFMRVIDSGDHSDMIQFWTGGTTQASTDIVIRGNILDSGTGWYTQSIFIGNELRAGRPGFGLFYQNVTIENNVIINAQSHGISAGQTNGLIIRNNTLVHNAASNGKRDLPALYVPRIEVPSESTDVLISHNAASAIKGFKSQSDWTVTDNLIIQDTAPGQPGYYDKVFVAARSGDPRVLANFAYLPGGPLAGKGIGAPQLDTPNPVLP